MVSESAMAIGVAVAVPLTAAIIRFVPGKNGHVSRDVCDERHGNLSAQLTRIEKKVDGLDERLVGLKVKV